MNPLIEDDVPPVETTATAEPLQPGATMSQPCVTMSQPDYEAALRSARAGGEEAQVHRFGKIAADPKVKGKEAFALKLACQAPQMPPEAVAAMCEEVPAAGPARSSLAERSAETGADQITSVPIPEVIHTAESWKAAIAAVNARTNADVSRRRH